VNWFVDASGRVRLAYDACYRSGNPTGSPQGGVGSPLVGVAPKLTSGLPARANESTGSALGSASLLAELVGRRARRARPPRDARRGTPAAVERQLSPAADTSWHASGRQRANSGHSGSSAIDTTKAMSQPSGSPALRSPSRRCSRSLGSLWTQTRLCLSIVKPGLIRSTCAASAFASSSCPNCA
jgi:hypothetical protein